MNRFLLCAALTLATCSFAHANETTTVSSLKSECAAKHSASVDLKGADANEFTFVYAKGEYRGEAQAGKQLPCTDRQYTAYLNTVDPVRVMSAYPSAAGRPSAKAASKP